MRPKFGLIAVICVTVAIFWAADIFLARMENTELQSEARHDADDGARLLATGHAAAAVDAFRKAHALKRGNDRYTLQLAEALVADGKLDEAQSTLTEVLETRPNDGRANLIEARVMERRGMQQEASAYYHRAIYGIWPEQADKQRIQVRLELANQLAERKSNQELLAELIPLESEAQHDLPVRRQVAHLYIVAGSPARAVTAYRALIRDDPQDGANYAGLGEAELALGSYRAAQSAFQNAIRHGAYAHDRLELATKMADLDPTVRSLSAMEKFTRSTSILQQARYALAQCSSTDQANKLVSDADTLLKAKIRGNVTNEMSEQRLAAAQDLWQLRVDTCPAAPPNEPLQLIMAKLAQ